MIARFILTSLCFFALLTVCVAQAIVPVRPVDESPPLFAPPIFEGWEQPRLLLFFTGFIEGYIEPCGCAGAEHMRGGLGRRHTALQQLERKGWDVLPIDAGNLNRTFGTQEELKFQFVIDEALRMMRYQAVGLGSRELLLPTDTLFLYTIDTPGVTQRYTSANVGLFEFTPEIVRPYRVLEKAGLRIGVVSVIGDSMLRNIQNEDIITANSAEKLQEVLTQLDTHQCDFKILIIHGSNSEIDQLLTQFAPRFDFVLPSNTPAEPPLQPRMIGDTLIIDVGERGRNAIAVGLFDDPAMPKRYQRIPMDSQFDNSPAILELLTMYQDELRQTGLSGLGIRPIPNPLLETFGGYIGVQTCRICHGEQNNVWRASRHAMSWESLTETSIPPRQHDPECIACHVVGWNTAELLPYQGGFLSLRATPRLASVGCESCHGPGENHVRAETGSDTELQEHHRSLRRLSVQDDSTRRHCITCHDGSNSPFFDFETYWEQISHPMR